MHAPVRRGLDTVKGQPRRLQRFLELVRMKS